MPRRGLGIPALAALTVVAATLNACGDPNAGDAAAEEFDTWWPERRVEGFEATASGNNTLPFAGELYVTVQSPPDVDADRVDEVRDVVCSFEPEASASVELELVGQVLTVPIPCSSGSSVGSGPVLALDAFLAGLDVTSAEARKDDTPRLEVFLPDATTPARARRVLDDVVDFLPTVPGVFIDRRGAPVRAEANPPPDVSVRFGRRWIDNEPATAGP